MSRFGGVPRGTPTNRCPALQYLRRTAPFAQTIQICARACRGVLRGTPAYRGLRLRDLLQHVANAVRRCGLGRLNAVRLSATIRVDRYAHQVSVRPPNGGAGVAGAFGVGGRGVGVEGAVGVESSQNS